MAQNHREQQVLEKHDQMTRNFQEEMFYAELWKRDLNNKEALEAEVQK